MKNIRIYYWVLNIGFAIFMLLDALVALTAQANAVELMNHLGFPLYFLTILGSAKLIGALVLFQDKWKTPKEWAYAGFMINFYGAIIARVMVGDESGKIIFPFVLTFVLLVIYFLWKKLD